MRKGIYLLVPCLLSLIVWMTWKGLAPKNSLSRLESLADSTQVVPDSLVNLIELQELIRDREFKQALTTLKKDSIHLIVNLEDTLVGLFINGVMIHKVRVAEFSMDPVLLSLSNRAYLHLFSKPIRIQNDTATIVKEPIVVRQAPKDTIEAALNAYKPDTLIQNPAFWLVELPGSIDLIFTQVEDRTEDETRMRRLFFEYVNSRNQGERFSRFLKFKRAFAPVTILIPVPVGDLRAIYRALPEKGHVVIRF